jgi:O-methyltransferase involved in polyketide biosynthesis
VVLHLGCGLDARVYRIDPPATVDWYDLDYPTVIELRQQCLPPHEHYTQIGSSVTDLTWLESIPRGRPLLMIAEGLVPYLTETEVRRLLTTVVDAFPTGQIQFDTVPVWAWRTSRWDPCSANATPSSTAASTTRLRWPIGTRGSNTSTRHRCTTHRC